MEDDLWHKTTFDRRRPLTEEVFWWKTTFNGRRPLTEDDPWPDIESRLPRVLALQPPQRRSGPCLSYLYRTWHTECLPPSPRPSPPRSQLTFSIIIGHQIDPIDQSECRIRVLFKLSLQLKGENYLYTGNLAAQAKLFLVCVNFCNPLRHQLPPRYRPLHAATTKASVPLSYTALAMTRPSVTFSPPRRQITKC